MKSTLKIKLLTLVTAITVIIAMTPLMAFAETDIPQSGNVAEINGTGYATLAGAIAAVTDSTPTTIKLLDNCNTYVAG
ncbi:MAG: hypothetical protein GX671_02040 [Clostridiales bacterium]|nr:hypothetical protein [Clostridiales bacterium]